MLTQGDVSHRLWNGDLAGVLLKEVTFELAEKEFLHIIWSVNSIHDSTNLVEEIFSPLLSWGGGAL